MFKLKLPKVFGRKKNKKLTKTQKEKRERKLTRTQQRKKQKLEAKNKKIIKSRVLIKQSFKQIKSNKKVFFGISVVYILLTMFFVRGVNGTFPLKSIQETVDSTYSTELNPWAKASAAYGLLVTSGTATPSELENVYQTIIVLFVSMAILWVLRMTYKQNKPLKVRRSFYDSTGQLIPLLLVLVIAMLQLFPFAIGSTLFSYVKEGGIAVTGPEQVFWYGVLFGSLILSAWLIIPTVFGLYIVTLPNSTPIRSIKQAWGLVRFLRIKIAFRFLALLILSVIVSAIVLIPLIVLFPPGAEVTYIVFSCLFLIFAHTYSYRLYRSVI